MIGLVWVIAIAISSAENDPRLPTSSVNIVSAVASSQEVMVCRLADLGFVEFVGPGESRYDNAAFVVVTQLKGTSSPRVTCSLRVTAHSLEDCEETPQVGRDYIVIGASGKGTFILGKLAAATPSNIAKVERLILDRNPDQGSPPAVTRAAMRKLASSVPTVTPAASPTSTVAENYHPVVERKLPVWPWLIGIAALTVMALRAWRRRE